MRTAAKVDRNHPEIVAALRGIGASVLSTAQLKGCFDILVGYRGINFIMEIKDGKKPPSACKLTDGEAAFKDAWRGGEYFVVHSVAEAISVVTGAK